ncbi:MAG: hypothetical protein H3Z54_14510 [archaeon]|nr:hypothetical protein [archaeon]
MRHSFKTGFSFGLTSGIITTLGLMVGLHSGTHSELAVHISEESECKHTKKEIWESTVSTFLSKFVFAITFVIPVLFLSLTTAIVAGIIWGLSLLGIFSFYLAKEQKVKSWEVIMEHLTIALAVIVIAHFVGDLIRSIFV